MDPSRIGITHVTHRCVREKNVPIRIHLETCTINNRKPIHINMLVQEQTRKKSYIFV